MANNLFMQQRRINPEQEQHQNPIIEYKERERGIIPLVEKGFQDMEFERTIHERIVIKK